MTTAATFAALAPATQAAIREMVANGDSDTIRDTRALATATPDQLHDLLQDLRNLDAND